MAKTLSRALGTDLASLAELLRSKGRGKDTILAHINPREAALLKKAGGSGDINPETGIMQFQDEDFGDYGGSTQPDPSYFDTSSGSGSTQPDPNYFDTSVTPVMAGGYVDTASGSGSTQPDQLYYAQGGGEYTGDAMGGPATIGPATAFGPKGQEIGVASAFQMTPEGAVQQIPQEQPSVLDRAGSAIGDTLGRAGKAVGGMDDKTLARLGLTGGLGLLGAFNARKAGAQSQAATAEQKAIAQPYTEAGQKLMTQAQSGQLSPQSQSALNAAKAQIAQSVANRGGVGQQQAANQIAQLQANLLDNQYKYGLQVAQIGDNITLGAIKTGLQLDRQLQSSTQNFYAQLAQIAGGGTYALPTTLPRG
jgi:hypothetical protein